MDDNFKQALLGFVGSSLGALISGYVGTIFGFRQARQSKAFEIRLKWYQDIIDKIDIIVTFIGISVEQSKQGLGRPNYMNMEGQVFELKELHNKAALYASREARLALANMWAKLDPLAPLFFSTDVDLDTMVPVATQAALDSATHLNEAKEALSKDVRKHLGLKN